MLQANIVLISTVTPIGGITVISAVIALALMMHFRVKRKNLPINDHESEGSFLDKTKVVTKNKGRSPNKGRKNLPSNDSTKKGNFLDKIKVAVKRHVHSSDNKKAVAPNRKKAVNSKKWQQAYTSQINNTAVNNLAKVECYKKRMSCINYERQLINNDYMQAANTDLFQDIKSRYLDHQNKENKDNLLPHKLKKSEIALNMIKASPGYSSHYLNQYYPSIFPASNSNEMNAIDFMAGINANNLCGDDASLSSNDENGPTDNTVFVLKAGSRNDLDIKNLSRVPQDKQSPEEIYRMSHSLISEWADELLANISNLPNENRRSESMNSFFSLVVDNAKNTAQTFFSTPTKKNYSGIDEHFSSDEFFSSYKIDLKYDQVRTMYDVTLCSYVFLFPLNISRKNNGALVSRALVAIPLPILLSAEAGISNYKSSNLWLEAGDFQQAKDGIRELIKKEYRFLTESRDDPYKSEDDALDRIEVGFINSFIVSSIMQIVNLRVFERNWGGDPSLYEKIRSSIKSLDSKKMMQTLSKTLPRFLIEKYIEPRPVSNNKSDFESSESDEDSSEEPIYNPNLKDFVKLSPGADYGLPVATVWRFCFEQLNLCGIITDSDRDCLISHCVSKTRNAFTTSDLIINRKIIVANLIASAAAKYIITRKNDENERRDLGNWDGALSILAKESEKYGLRFIAKINENGMPILSFDRIKSQNFLVSNDEIDANYREISYEIPFGYLLISEAIANQIHNINFNDKRMNNDFASNFAAASTTIGNIGQPLPDKIDVKYTDNEARHMVIKQFSFDIERKPFIFKSKPQTKQTTYPLEIDFDTYTEELGYSRIDQNVIASFQDSQDRKINDGPSILERALMQGIAYGVENISPPTAIVEAEYDRSRCSDETDREIRIRLKLRTNLLGGRSQDDDSDNIEDDLNKLRLANNILMLHGDLGIDSLLTLVKTNNGAKEYHITWGQEKEFIKQNDVGTKSIVSLVDTGDYTTELFKRRAEINAILFQLNQYDNLACYLRNLKEDKRMEYITESYQGHVKRVILKYPNLLSEPDCIDKIRYLADKQSSESGMHFCQPYSRIDFDYPDPENSEFDSYYRGWRLGELFFSVLKDEDRSKIINNCINNLSDEQSKKETKIATKSIIKQGARANAPRSVSVLFANDHLNYESVTKQCILLINQFFALEEFADEIFKRQQQILTIFPQRQHKFGEQMRRNQGLIDDLRTEYDLIINDLVEIINRGGRGVDIISRQQIALKHYRENKFSEIIDGFEAAQQTINSRIASARRSREKKLSKIPNKVRISNDFPLRYAEIRTGRINPAIDSEITKNASDAVKKDVCETMEELQKNLDDATALTANAIADARHKLQDDAWRNSSPPIIFPSARLCEALCIRLFSEDSVAITVDPVQSKYFEKIMSVLLGIQSIISECTKKILIVAEEKSDETSCIKAEEIEIMHRNAFKSLFNAKRKLLPLVLEKKRYSQELEKNLQDLIINCRSNIMKYISKLRYFSNELTGQDLGIFTQAIRDCNNCNDILGEMLGSVIFYNFFLGTCKQFASDSSSQAVAVENGSDNSDFGTAFKANVFEKLKNEPSLKNKDHNNQRGLLTNESKVETLIKFEEMLLDSYRYNIPTDYEVCNKITLAINMLETNTRASLESQYREYYSSRPRFPGWEQPEDTSTYVLLYILVHKEFRENSPEALLERSDRYLEALARNDPRNQARTNQQSGTNQR